MSHKHYNTHQIVKNSQNIEFELANSNPYILQNKPILNNLMYGESYQNLIMIKLPDHLLNKAILLEKYKCSVKFICSCDIISSIYYMLIFPFYGIITMICSTSGLISVINYNRTQMFLYLFYQYLQTFIRFINLVILILLYTDYSLPSYLTNIHTSSTLYFDIIILSILFPMQCCITKYIHQYYNLLPTKQDIEELSISNL